MNALTEIEKCTALMGEGRLIEAQSGLESVLSVEPHNVDAWLALGQVRGMLGIDAGAESAFREALRRRPDMYEIQFNVALSLAYQNRFQEALPFFTEARRINSDIPGLNEVFLKVLLRVLHMESTAIARRESALEPLPEHPLVSVIIPTRDRLPLLKDALESLVRQTYANWECIVINDGGEDVCAALTALPEDKASRMIRVESIRPEGPAAARNKGLAVATGQVMAFLDDDDIYLPHHLWTLVEGLRKSGVGACYTQTVGIIERLDSGRRIECSRGSVFPEFHYSPLALEVRNFIPINNWGIRREFFQAAGPFDVNLACAEDWEMLLRLTKLTDFNELSDVTTETHIREDVADSVSKRNKLLPACEMIYQRHPTSHPMVNLAREIYLSSIS